MTDLSVFMILLWIPLTIVVGLAAEARGRPLYGWIVFALFASPLAAGFSLMILPDLVGRALIEKQIALLEVISRDGAPAAQGDTPPAGAPNGTAYSMDLRPTSARNAPDNSATKSKT